MDNESGKGDHRYFDGSEEQYSFSTPEQLIADFEQDIARWNDENRPNDAVKVEFLLQAA